MANHPLATVVSSGAEQTMSSREIAKLTGKRHDHVMRDIRTILVDLYGEGDLPRFGGVYLGGNGEERPCFNLPRHETLVLISGYNVQIRSKIIARWDELEARNNPALAAGMVLAKLEAVEDRLARIDGMGKMTVHKVTGLEREVGLSARLDETVALLVERKFAELQMAVVPDLTAGEVIEMAGITDMKGLRRLARWVSDRLRQVHAERRVAVRRAKLGRTRAYVFDERVCRDWLIGGGKEAMHMRAQEMRGQHVLRLVVPAKGDGQ